MDINKSCSFVIINCFQKIFFIYFYPFSFNFICLFRIDNSFYIKICVISFIKKRINVSIRINIIKLKFNQNCQTNIIRNPKMESFISNRIEALSWQDIQILEKQLMNMRHLLKPDQNQSKVKQLAVKIIKDIQKIHTKVNQALTYLSNGQRIEQIKQSKLSMYYFQLLNLLLINLGEQGNLKGFQPSLVLNNIYVFSQIQSIVSIPQSKAFKALLIFYYNLLKRISQEFVQKQQIYLIFDILSIILSSYFVSHTDQNVQKQTKFKEQTQWMGFIFQILPMIEWKQISNDLSRSFIQNYFNHLDQQQYKEQSLKRRSKYHLLHMIGNFFHLVIQSKTTTELIKGYECPIEDVKQMYSNSSKNKLCNLKLTQEDIQFISQLLIKDYLEEKSLFRKIFTNIQESIKKAYEFPEEYIMSIEDSEVTQFDQKVKFSDFNHQEITIGDLLIEIINLLNSALFLGGYNPKLQTLIYQKLFSNHILPQFLELAYLIYNQRRFMGKYSIKVTLAKPPDANLSKILQIDYESVTKDQRQAVYKLIGQQIKYGQLSVLLRLMTKLIHINNKALQYFQTNTKYLHMIMSLTHDSQMNLTMKNWAILFIKNSCDSQILRDQIGKIKIEMKVED